MSGAIYNYIEPTGVIVPDVTTLKNDVDAEWKGAFNNEDLNTDSSTPQGVIIASDVSARTALVRNNATLANQINPNQAAGIFLDAICALTGLQRNADIPSRAPAMILAGVQNSPVAAGTVLRSPAGDLFALDSDVTLDAATGEAVGLFIAQVAGPLPVAAGSWAIVTGAIGLETATNPSAGIVGSLEQSDESLAELRRETLALQGIAIAEAVTSQISDISGVIGRQFRENVASTTQTIDDVVMVAHSVWVCVDGGSDADIAAALLRAKGSGAAWNGTQTVDTIEPSSGQTYTVKFDRPTEIPLLVRVTVSQGTFVGPLADSVTNAVVAFAANQIPNLKGFVVGQSASPFEVASGVVTECQGIYVKKVEISLVSPISYQTTEIAMEIFQKATVTSGDVSVVIV